MVFTKDTVVIFIYALLGVLFGVMINFVVLNPLINAFQLSSLVLTTLAVAILLALRKLV